MTAGETAPRGDAGPALAEPPPAAPGPRVLILTASVGEGHNGPARTLREQLLAEREDVEVVTEDALEAMGGAVRWLSADSAEIVFYRFQWVWDVGFWLFAGSRPTRRATQALLTRAGGPGLLRLLDAVAPDVIVSVYPNATEVLGRLRLAGRIRVPVVAAITDLAAMHYWATPGADLHLVTHRESIEEVQRVAGASAAVQCVHGFSPAELRAPCAPAEARARLGLPATGAVVLVSGGGWGVGDIDGAIEEALRPSPVALVVCLCGHNERLRARVSARFAGDERVRVEGFTEQMPDWLAAADALVHSTGGLTVTEALVRGCVPISYGWGRGHLRRNNEAFRRFGLAEVAGDRTELRAALPRALARGRSPIEGFADLPSAASFVLAAADGARSDRQTAEHGAG